MAIRTITADEIVEGHMLVDLGSGYVYADPDETLYGMVDISYHDECGEECTWQIPPTTEVRVDDRYEGGV